MRVFRVKLERSAADLGMPGASGLPPPSSWPSDYYWVQACSDTSWRVVRALSREQQYLRRVVVGRKGKAFRRSRSCHHHRRRRRHPSLGLSCPNRPYYHATALVALPPRHPLPHTTAPYPIAPCASCLVPLPSSAPSTTRPSLVSPRLVAFRPRPTVA